MTALSPAGMSVLADSDTGKGSPIGLFVVLVLVIAVYFLYRSMNRHLRKLPSSFDPPPEQPLAGQKSLADQSDNPAAGVTEPPASPRGPGPDRL